MKAEAERAGVMIVRIWIESAHEHTLRARLTESSDLASTEQTTHTASTVDEVVAIVRAWAQGFVAR
jgi:hypothetical protein